MAAWSDHITVQQVTDQHEDVRWLQYNLRAEDYIELLETKTDITVFAFDDTMENHIAYDEDHMPLFLFGVSKEPLYGYVILRVRMWIEIGSSACRKTPVLRHPPCEDVD